MQMHVTSVIACLSPLIFSLSTQDKAPDTIIVTQTFEEIDKRNRFKEISKNVNHNNLVQLSSTEYKNIGKTEIVFLNHVKNS